VVGDGEACRAVDRGACLAASEGLAGAVLGLVVLAGLVDQSILVPILVSATEMSQLIETRRRMNATLECIASSKML
jgi:hypothetical protein